MSTSITTKTATVTDLPENRRDGHSAIYHWIMTPINFISFLISLYLVDCHYYNRREHIHDNSTQGRLPVWLHEIIFRPQPYSWVGGGIQTPPSQDDRNWYYHTKQKKLMKMEATAAFEIRRSVLMALIVLALGLIWGSLRLVGIA